ncbi:MAG: hypothetical protein Q8R92_19315 [Deltaproteobacteria bacterium]|nr:hypothetical protein [Deltaproteobacteria bacterium]
MDFRQMARSAPNTTWMFITPEMAAWWLTLNTRNRPIRSRAAIAKMVRELLAGTYISSHQGIAFYSDGVLADGQHRLTAIVEAGVAAFMPVTVGLSEATAPYIDGSLIIRTVAEAATIEHGQRVSNAHQGTLAGMFVRRKKWWDDLTRQERIALLIQHSETIITVTALLDTAPAGVRQGIVAGVLARVLYVVGGGKTMRIGSLLTTGESLGEGDRVLVRLRNLLIATPGSRMEKHKRYSITERGIDAYLKGESLQIIRPAKDELFPLPDEEA